MFIIASNKIYQFHHDRHYGFIATGMLPRIHLLCTQYPTPVDCEFIIGQMPWNMPATYD